MNVEDLDVFHRPRSVAVVGASEDPDKIGGRPLRYMREFGYRGRVFPVNPRRPIVQGLEAFARLSELPETPDVVLVAVPGPAAYETVDAAASIGARGCVVMSSGFGETGDPQGRQLQDAMVSRARAVGMRLVGPNSQGLACFASGAILGFSTMFIEAPPADGPVAVISQSGAMSSVPYGLLRGRGIGVRYVHGTGNDADVGVGDLAAAIVQDPDVRLVVLYLEDIRDPKALEEAAAAAVRRGVAVVALMGGRSVHGQRAARSHTGAMANEQRVVDAFFRRIGVWRARSMTDLLQAVELYLQGWQARGRRLAVVSNSGAVCVTAADAAADFGLELAELDRATAANLADALPPFATSTNPIDITAALLSDSSLFGKVLPPLGSDPNVDACLIGLPVSGQGYDVPRFAADAAALAGGDDKPLIVATPQPTVAATFRAAGLVVFEDEYVAVSALAQYLKHHELMERARSMPSRLSRRQPGRDPGGDVVLSEAAALRLLQAAGLPVVRFEECSDAESSGRAFDRLGACAVVVKGQPTAATHKTELGLVRLGLRDVGSVAQAAAELIVAMDDQGLQHRGILVAEQISARIEVMIGGHVDPVFGPVVLFGAGGKYVEAVDDVAALLPPFDVEDVLHEVGRLRLAALLGEVRGDPAVDVGAWAAATVRLGELLLRDTSIRSVDLNPLLLLPVGSVPGAVAVDAVVMRSQGPRLSGK